MIAGNKRTGAPITNFVRLSTPVSSFLLTDLQSNPYCPPPTMLCGNASWVAGLLCACIVMLGPMGHPVEDAQMGSTFATKVKGTEGNVLVQNINEVNAVFF